MALALTTEHLELRKRDEPKLGGIFVDFVGGAMAHRRKFGGGRGEAVAPEASGIASPGWPIQAITLLQGAVSPSGSTRHFSR